MGTPVGSFSTTDPDISDLFGYSFIAGDGDADNASFNIVGAEFRTNTPLDFETRSSYSIRVRTTDAYGSFFDKQFTISVNNLFEATTLNVSRGLTQRSFVRHLDLAFADSAAAVQSLISGGRVQVKRYGLDGSGAGALSGWQG